MGSTHHHQSRAGRAGLRLALLFLLSGCAAAPIRPPEVAVAQGQVRGVKVGDVLPENLEPLALRPLRSPAFIEELADKATYAEGSDPAKANVFALNMDGLPAVTVVAPREGPNTRRVRLIGIWGVPLPDLEPGELLGVTKDPYNPRAIHRTARPGVFVVVALRKVLREPQGYLFGPEDLPASGLLVPLDPPDSERAVLYGGLELQLARAEREGWGIARLARPLSTVWRTAQYGSPSQEAAIAQCKELIVPLVARKRTEWVRELADLDARSLAALHPMLNDAPCVYEYGKPSMWQDARALHLEETFLAGRWLTAAGEARVLRAPTHTMGGVSQAPTPRPTSADLFLRAPPLFPDVQVSHNGFSGWQFFLKNRLPGFTSTTSRKSVGVVDVAIAEQVVGLSGAFASQGSRTVEHRDLARLEYEKERKRLQAEATKAAREAEAHRDFARLEEKSAMLKRRVNYVDKFGEVVRETTEEYAGSKQVLVVDDLKKGRFERAAAEHGSAVARLEKLDAKAPPVYTETFDFGTQTWSGLLQWKVTLSGAAQDTFELELDAAKLLGTREGARVLEETALSELQSRASVKVVERLTPLLRQLGRARVDRHLATLKDPKARAQEAAWARFWLGEPPEKDDEALGVPADPKVREDLLWRRGTVGNEFTAD